MWKYVAILPLCTIIPVGYILHMNDKDTNDGEHREHVFIGRTVGCPAEWCSYHDVKYIGTDCAADIGYWPWRFKELCRKCRYCLI